MFDLTKPQRDIQKAARAFAKGEFEKTLCYELDRSQQFPTDVWETACALGFIGMHFPEELAGQSLSMLDHLIVMETLCRKDSTLGAALALSTYGAECLIQFASDSLKEKFLPMMAEGQLLSGAAVFPGSLTASIPEAVANDAGWIINGEAHQVVNGEWAGCYILLCRTDADTVPEKAMSMFIVTADQAGVAIGSQAPSLGLRMTPACDLTLRDVQVSAECLIGKPGAGMTQARAFHDISRLLFAAMALGIAQGALDRGLDYAKQRVQFGEKIARFQVTAHKLAAMATQIEQARFLTYQAAATGQPRRMDSKLIAMAKTVADQAAVNVSSEAVQLLGGYGYASEYEVERCYRDAKTLAIHPEPPESLKNDIARAVVGKIRK